MVERQTNWLGQMRVDVPLLRAMESSVAADFDVQSGWILSGKQALVVGGFKLTNIAVGSAATAIQVLTAGSVLINYNASESGSIFQVPSNRSPETLNSTNTVVSGSWTANATNFIGVDLLRSADATTSDTLQFLNGTTLTEVPKNIPLARTLNYRFVISTTSFSAQPNLVPIAKVVTDSNTNIVSIQDCRNIMGRVAPGGDFAAINQGYNWPGGRFENLTGDIFSNGDKGISSVREWMQAAMTRIWEIGGGQYWYSATADRNVTVIWWGATLSNGENFSWSGTNLTWQNVRFIFDNSTGIENDIADQTSNSPGLTDLADGACLYVDLDRSQCHAKANWAGTTGYAVGYTVQNNGNVYINTTLGTSAGSGGPTGTTSGQVDNSCTWDYLGPGVGTPIQPVKGFLSTMGTPVTPGSRHVLAWRIGTQVYTKNWIYPIGTTFTPATASSVGVVQLSRNDNTPSTPIVISDAGGTITAISNVTGLTVTGFNNGAGNGGQGLTVNGGTGTTSGGSNAGTFNGGNGTAGNTLGGNGVGGFGGNGFGTQTGGFGGNFGGGTGGSSSTAGGIGAYINGGAGSGSTNGIGGAALSLDAGNGNGSGGGGTGLLINGGAAAYDNQGAGGATGNGGLGIDVNGGKGGATSGNGGDGMHVTGGAPQAGNVNGSTAIVAIGSVAVGNGNGGVAINAIGGNPVGTGATGGVAILAIGAGGRPGLNNAGGDAIQGTGGSGGTGGSAEIGGNGATLLGGNGQNAGVGGFGVKATGGSTAPGGSFTAGGAGTQATIIPNTQNYGFATTVSKAIHLLPSDFNSFGLTTGYGTNISSSRVWIIQSITSGATAAYVATVRIPTGATVTAVQVLANNTHASIDYSIFSYAQLMTYAAGGSYTVTAIDTGAPNTFTVTHNTSSYTWWSANQSWTSTQIATGVVGTSEGVVQIIIGVPQTAATGNVNFQGARVLYTMPNLTPPL
jgi:hypothetical protein